MPHVQVNGISLYYEKNGDGPWLTILGGLGDTTRNWGTLTNQLTKHFTVLLLDHRGSGQSEKTLPPYSMELFAQDTIALWKSLGIVKSNVLGFSMGGMIAQELAITHPERMEKLILISSSPNKKRFPPKNLSVPQILESYTHEEIHYSQTYKLLFSKTFQKKYSTQTFVKFQLGHPHPQPKENFLAQYYAVRNFDSTGHLHKITCPTLILLGDSDEMSSKEGAEFLHKHIAGSKLILYNDCGHIPQAEQPKKFLQDVLEFLK